MRDEVRIIDLPARDRRPLTLPGVVVVVDVIRAFTTAAVLAGRGAHPLIIHADLDGAQRAHAADPTALLVAEWEPRPDLDLGIGNSPAAVARTDVAGRRAILCTTNGTPALVAVRGDGGTVAAAAVNLTATVRWIQRYGGPPVTICCTDPAGREDRACADAIATLLAGGELDVARVGERLSAGVGDHLRRWAASAPAATRAAFLRDAAVCVGVDTWPVALRVEHGADDRAARLVPTPD